MLTEFNYCIDTLKAGNSLSVDQAKATCLRLFHDEIPHDDIILLLELLANKGESSDEILGFVHAMREKMTPIKFNQKHILDLCGTGGSLVNRFNVSTCVALTLGSIGYNVAKHGNRGSKKANGSFDFLDALGIPYNLSNDDHQYRLNDHGATFLFARTYHKAVAAVAEARRNFKKRSIFNLIGPFCNPASPETQVIGTPSIDVAKTLLDVGKQLPYSNFAVISSEVGLDEVSTVGESIVLVNRNGAISDLKINPTEFGIQHTLSDIIVSNEALAVDNAKVFKDIIQQRLANHPITELICLNSAVIIHIADNSKSIQASYHKAKTVFQTGKLDYLFLD